MQVFRCVWLLPTSGSTTSTARTASASGGTAYTNID
jgi:hypothetical protein